MPAIRIKKRSGLFLILVVFASVVYVFLSFRLSKQVRRADDPKGIRAGGFLGDALDWKVDRSSDKNTSTPTAHSSHPKEELPPVSRVPNDRQGGSFCANCIFNQQVYGSVTCLGRANYLKRRYRLTEKQAIDTVMMAELENCSLDWKVDRSSDKNTSSPTSDKNTGTPATRSSDPKSPLPSFHSIAYDRLAAKLCTNCIFNEQVHGNNVTCLDEAENMMKRDPTRDRLSEKRAVYAVMTAEPENCIIGNDHRPLVMDLPKEITPDDAQETEENSGPSLVVDVLSIGSISRIDYLQAQKETLGSHKSVRFFFNMTEHDDADQGCHRLSTEEILKVPEFCKKPLKFRNYPLMRYMSKTHYARKEWLLGKANPTGWVCAQARTSQGFAKVLKFYRESNELPDYLIVTDDDTYINMELFQQYVQSEKVNKTANVMAGCLIRQRLHEYNQTMPYGGFGTFYNRGALENFVRPIWCNNTDHFTTVACQRLQHGGDFGEHFVFREGMSLSDVVGAQATWQPFTQLSNWTHGFCQHSDWISGYYSNYYPVSEKADGGAFRDVPYLRLDTYLGSHMYVGKQTIPVLKGYRNCAQDGIRRCPLQSHICHRIKPDEMRWLTAQTRSKFPNQFRKVSSNTD